MKPYANKGYAFDIDDNLLYTDLKVYVEKKSIKQTAKGIEVVWEEIEIPDKELKSFLEKPAEYRYPQNDPERCYRLLRKPGELSKNLMDAFSQHKLGHSRGNFKRANQNADPLALITARGNAVEELILAHTTLIYEAFQQEEREEMLQNIRKKIAPHQQTQQDLIKTFIEHNYYAPCSNHSYAESKGMQNISSIPQRKVIAFEDFIHHMRKHPSFCEGLKTKLGFSDDTVENLLAMQEAIKTTFIAKYPEIIFTTYNTNHPAFIEKTTYQNRAHYEATGSDLADL